MSRSLLALLVSVAVASASNVCVDQPCAPSNVIADYVVVIDSSNAVETWQFEAIRSWLLTWTATLNIDSAHSQLAFYTYGNAATSSGKLNQLNDATKVSDAIKALTYEGMPNRNLNAALTLQDSEVTTANGLRADAEKLLIVIVGDYWTGDDIFPASAAAAQAKYDAVLAITIGAAPLEDALHKLRELVVDDSNLMVLFDISQLPYAGLWLSYNGCPQAHTPPTTLAPTTMPTPDPRASCDLKNLNTDIYLILDTSAAMSSADFLAMRQDVYDFVSVFPIGMGQTQFGLITTYSDTQLFYTGINADNFDRAALLKTISTVQQENGNGQTITLSLQAIENMYLKSSQAAKKLVVYFTGNTNFDSDPSAYLDTLYATYGLQAYAVKWTPNASDAALNSFAGSNRCVNDGSLTGLRPDVNTDLELDICTNVKCRG